MKHSFQGSHNDRAIIRRSGRGEIPSNCLPIEFSLQPANGGLAKDLNEQPQSRLDNGALGTAYARSHAPPHQAVINLHGSSRAHLGRSSLPAGHIL